MLRIRLSRVGKKKQPSYRIVVADSRAPRDGANLGIIGHYNPLTNPPTIVIKEEQALHWLKSGARPSETAAKLLTRLGVMEKAGLEPVKRETRQTPRKKPAAEPKPAPAAASAAPPEEPAADAGPEAAAEPAPAPAAKAAAAPEEPAADTGPEAAAEPAPAGEPTAETESQEQA